MRTVKIWISKDLRAVWPVLAIWLGVLALQVAFAATLGGESLGRSAWEVRRVLALMVSAVQGLVMLVLVAMVVQLDPPGGDPRAFWLTRPVTGGKLLGSKALFFALFILVPALAAELLALAVQGFGWGLLARALPEIVLQVSAWVAVLALVAALTRGFRQYVLAVILLAFASGGTRLAAGILGAQHDLGLFSPAAEMMRTGRLQSSELIAWLAALAVCGATLPWVYRTRKRLMPALAAGVALLGVQAARSLYPCDFLPSAADEARAGAARALTADRFTLSFERIEPWSEPPPGPSRRYPNLGHCLFAVGGEAVEGLSVRVVRGVAVVKDSEGKSLCQAKLGSEFSAEEQGEGGALSASAKLGSHDGPVRGLIERYGEVRSRNAQQPEERPHVSALARFEDCSEALEKVGGGAVQLSGWVELAFSRSDVAGAVPLRTGMEIVNGAARARIVAVTPGAGQLRVTLRRRTSNLFFSPDNKETGLQERVDPCLGRAYALINRKRGNEVALATGSELTDGLLTFEMMVRSGLPARTEYAHADLIFPPQAPEWLKDAELVCLEERPAGKVIKEFDAGSVRLPAELFGAGRE